MWHFRFGESQKKSKRRGADRRELSEWIRHCADWRPRQYHLQSTIYTSYRQSIANTVILMSWKTDKVYADLPECEPLLLAESNQEVAIRVLQQFEGHSQVVLFEHWFIVIHYGQFVISNQRLITDLFSRCYTWIDEVLISESRMIDVVNGAWEYGCENFQIAENVGKDWRGQQHVHRLGYICAVDRVVVRVVSDEDRLLLQFRLFQLTYNDVRDWADK